MMTNFSLTPASPVSAEQDNHPIANGTLDPANGSWCYPTDLKLTVTSTFVCVASLFGLLGNGAVIWLLGCCMKRTPVTTYILNLAVADFGVLLSGILIAISYISINYCISPIVFLHVVGMILHNFMFSMSQFLLTIISIDRCVSVFLPVWYRCHRPENLSTILCALIWIFCFLVNVTCSAVDILRVFPSQAILYYVFLVDAVICLPLITISSLILVIKFSFKTQQRQRGKLLMAILLALFFFLFLAFPLNVIILMRILPLPSYGDFYELSYHDILVGYLCAALNSVVNPLIYFLVGRKKGLCKENLKLIFQRIFKQEEEMSGEELHVSTQSQVSAQLHRTACSTPLQHQSNLS